MADLKYARVANELRREIQDGLYAPGEKLPAETELVARFRVSLPTIRQSMGVLRSEGVIESRQGIGTFVKDQRRRQRRSRNRYGRARGDKQLLTSDLRHEIVFAGRTRAPDRIAELMALPAGSDVVVRRRVLHDPHSDRPEEIGASYIPIEIASGTLLEEKAVTPKALFLCVEELSGKRYTNARDQWIIRPATDEEAETLEIAPVTPVLHLTHIARAEDDQVIEVSESIWPADRVMVVDDYGIEQEETFPESRSEV